MLGLQWLRAAGDGRHDGEAHTDEIDGAYSG